MESAQELLDLFSNANYQENYSLAKATDSCLRCGSPAKMFKDKASRLEYAISALCQTCQDELFKIT